MTDHNVNLTPVDIDAIERTVVALTTRAETAEQTRDKYALDAMELTEELEVETEKLADRLHDAERERDDWHNKYDNLRVTHSDLITQLIAANNRANAAEERLRAALWLLHTLTAAYRPAEPPDESEAS